MPRRPVSRFECLLAFPGESDTMASVPEAKEGAVVEVAEEYIGECNFIEV